MTSKKQKRIALCMCCALAACVVVSMFDRYHRTVIDVVLGVLVMANAWLAYNSNHPQPDTLTKLFADPAVSARGKQ